MTLREHRQDGREHQIENTIKQTNWGEREGETQTLIKRGWKETKTGRGK